MTISHLGQSGFRLRLGAATVYVDPYLSDSVEAAEGQEMRRLRTAPLRPDQVDDADHVLVSHAHLDHCDPATLVPIATSCPACRFVASFEAAGRMTGPMCIEPDRVVVAGVEGIELSRDAVVRPVPAAHRDLETDELGRPRYAGFLIEYSGLRIYHAGDGSVHPDVVRAVRSFGRIDIAMLPVNECNYYRGRRGIVGNMSIREAFGYAEEIGAGRVIPMHYDMFGPNCVYEDEILAVYRNAKPRFTLDLPRENMSL